MQDIDFNLILASPEKSYLHARHVARGRFELGEPVIATDSHYSYLYALNVIKDRFEAGEEAMAKSREVIFSYSIKVLKDRFELAEERLDGDPYWMSWYVKELRDIDVVDNEIFLLDNKKAVRNYLELIV